MLDKFTYYFKEGFPKGDSDYIIATEEPLNQENPLIDLKKVKWAIYDREGNRLTDFFDWISPLGLVKGQSPYFRVTKDGKDAIFSLQGQITPWFRKIRDRGALTGESKYYWGKKEKTFALYDIETGEKLTPEFKSSVLAGAVIGVSKYVVGSYGEEIFFIYDFHTGEKISRDFDEDELIYILKELKGNLEKALDYLKIIDKV